MARQGLIGSDSTGISPKNGCLKKVRGAQFEAKSALIKCCEGATSPGVKDQGSAHHPLNILIMDYTLLFLDLPCCVSEFNPILTYQLLYPVLYLFCYQKLFNSIKENSQLPYHEGNVMWGTL